MDRMDAALWICFIACMALLGSIMVNYVTADIKTEIVVKKISYMSDETVLELYGNFLSGTSGGNHLKVVCGIITSDGIQIHSERLENNNVFIREENTTNPRIEIYMEHKIGGIQPCRYISSQKIKTVYIVPYGTVKKNFEIDYK